MSEPSNKNVRAASLVLIAVAFNAATASTLYFARDLADWSALAFGRLVVGIAFVMIMARIEGDALFVKPERWGWVRCVASGLGVPAAYYAFSHLSPTDAVTLMYTAPMWAVLLQNAAKRRWPEARVGVAIVIAALGVILLERPEFSALHFAVGVALFNGACRGLSIMSSGRVSSTPATAQVFHSNIAALLSTSLIVGWAMSEGRGDPRSGLELTFALLVALLAAFTILSSVFSTRGLMIGSTERIAPLFYLAAPVVLAVEVVFFGISIDTRHLVGMSLVIGAALVTTTAKRRAHLCVSVRSEWELPDRERISELGEAFITQTETDALVEVRVHVEREEVEDRRAHALATFDSFDMSETSRGHGLLVVLFDDGELVLVGDSYLEDRLSEARLKRLADCSELEEVLLQLRIVLADVLPAAGARENEVPDEITFSGFLAPTEASGIHPVPSSWASSPPREISREWLINTLRPGTDVDQLEQDRDQTKTP